jgi:hypothetical protein
LGNGGDGDSAREEGAQRGRTSRNVSWSVLKKADVVILNEVGARITVKLCLLSEWEFALP